MASGCVALVPSKMGFQGTRKTAPWLSLILTLSGTNTLLISRSNAQTKPTLLGIPVKESHQISNPVTTVAIIQYLLGHLRANLKCVDKIHKRLDVPLVVTFAHQPIQIL